MKRILILTFLVLAVPGCRKEEEAPRKPEEQRWLRIYREGRIVDSINVTGWEVNEDLVYPGQGDFYYPWQGEDSIYYRGNYYDSAKENPFPWLFLVVNGKVVGVDMSLVPAEDIHVPEDILTGIIFYRDDLNDIEQYPNLVAVSTPYDFLEEVDSINSDLRLYVEIYETTRWHLIRLRRFQQIRALYLSDAERIKPWDLALLWRLNNLRLLEIEKSEKRHLDGKNLKYLFRILPNLRLIKLKGRFAIWDIYITP